MLESIFGDSGDRLASAERDLTQAEAEERDALERLSHDESLIAVHRKARDRVEKARAIVEARRLRHARELAAQRDADLAKARHILSVDADLDRVTRERIDPKVQRLKQLFVEAQSTIEEIVSVATYREGLIQDARAIAAKHGERLEDPEPFLLSQLQRRIGAKIAHIAVARSVAGKTTFSLDEWMGPRRHELAWDGAE